MSFISWDMHSLDMENVCLQKKTETIECNKKSPYFLGKMQILGVNISRILRINKCEFLYIGRF